MTKTELKHRAQDQLMGWMVEAIYRAEADGDKELAAEMLRQARRAMTMFGVVSYPGLGED
jgi:hypothetical protein